MMTRRIVLLLLICFSAWGGYTLGTSHNRPRFFINRHILHLYASKPVDDPNYKPKKDHWKVIKARFDRYEDESKFVVEENWFTWAKNENGENIRKVKLVYNTISNEVALVCEKEDCSAQ
jgi:hypothetical protein